MITIVMKKAASVAAPATYQGKTILNHHTTPRATCQQRLHAKLREDAMYRLGYELAQEQIADGKLAKHSVEALRGLLRFLLARDTPYSAGTVNALRELIHARRLS